MSKTKKLASVLMTLMLASCTSTSEDRYAPSASYLEKDVQIKNAKLLEANPSVSAEEERGGVTYHSAFDYQASGPAESVNLMENFSDSEMIQITVDELPVKAFLHHIFGELLQANYVLGEKAQEDNRNLTLNIQDSISKRKLFTLSEELLLQRDYVIRYDDGIYYIHTTENTGQQGDIAFGYGKNVENVPSTTQNIVQMVPMSFGLPTSLANTLRNLTKVQATPDFERSALLLQGKRRDILRGLEFINLIDQPQFQGRQIASYKSNFVPVSELVKSLSELLKQEGITISLGQQTDRALTVIPIDRIATMVMFASDPSVIARAAFWVEELDQPASGNEQQYFIFHPDYSRASDIAETLQLLITGESSGRLANSTSASQQNSAVTDNNASPRAIGVHGENVSLVVDPRSNSLIFQTTGEEYRKLLPMIKRLDVLPKQVMLEVMIAEVTLTDEFKQGVEFSFRDGRYGAGTQGSFFGDGFGGLSYLLQGFQGELAINLFTTNSLVNILSRPSLVVRDGVEASITVGTDIPVIGQTASDPINGERQTTSIEYRKTGVELEVRPSVNAQGLVIMEINQKISNEVDGGGSTVAGNPTLFERSIKTEVVAESGQTVVLGGLISENKSSKDTRVPGFGDIPLIGKLFQAETDSGDKTELVVMVTPRIIESSKEWDEIRANFDKELKKITIY